MVIAVVAMIVFVAVAFVAAPVVVMAVISVSVISGPMVAVVAVSMSFRSMIVVPAIVVVMIVGFRSCMFLMALFAAFLIALMGTVCHFMPMVLVFPELMMLRIVTDGIRMVIFVAIDPSPLPRSVVDEYDAAVPGNAVVTPAPGTKGNSHSNAEAEADCRPDEEARARARIDNDRIVVRNHNVVGTRRHDRDIRAASHDDLRTAAQISIVARALPHSLYRIHHFLLLAEKSVAYIIGPAHVRSHHVQHIGKWKQRLHRGVPGQLITFNGRCQLTAG